MAYSDGEVAATRTNLSPSGTDAGEDRVSALPDDILVLILLKLSVDEAARTSVLSRRWRRTWVLLPELIFTSATNNLHIREVLEAPEAPALRRIVVITTHDTPESMAAWLPHAARRLSGNLIYDNWVEGHEELDEEEEQEEGGTIPLPCFGNATDISLQLGFLALALPSSGVFTRLTKLSLVRVRFQGTCELGDIVSSPRCPCLRLLVIKLTWGVARLTIHSESLLEMKMFRLNGLQQLSIDTPVLNELAVHNSFVPNQPVANISAPQLISLVWWDAYDPSSVQLGNLEQLQRLSPDIITVYGDHDDNEYNREVLRFLQHFQAIHSLYIVLDYLQDIRNLQYLMEDITHLPHVTVLIMSVVNRGHTFGAASFHVLRLCTGIRRLSMVLRTVTSCNLEAQSACPSGCICDQPANWNIEELQLYCLQEVEITSLKGIKHEFAFLKQLFNWAVVLKKLKIVFDYCVSKSKAREFCQRLSSISRPETAMEFCMYRDSDRMSVELLLLEDEGTGV